MAEVLTFRYSSVAGRGTNDLERKYHEAAKLLVQSEGAQLAESRAVLIAAMPDAEEFRVNFERLTMGRQYLLRYTLAKIEQSLSSGAEKQLKTSDLVHIEHVMPQKLSAAWHASLGEDVQRHVDYVNRWGNLTLFFASYNIPASNKGFPEKQAYYAKSDVVLTTRLCDFDTWGPEQIKKRQRWLGEVAENLWRVELPPAAASLQADARAVFQQSLGELWEAVEPFCQEVSTDEIRQLAERLPAHLASHAANSGDARKLADELAELLQPWDRYDGGQRSVARAAAAYFLESSDAVPDALIGGLMDDAAVVHAAREALTN